MQKTNATGYGAISTKKLCGRLGLNLNITSKRHEYTRLTNYTVTIKRYQRD